MGVGGKGERRPHTQQLPRKVTEPIDIYVRCLISRQKTGKIHAAPDTLGHRGNQEICIQITYGRDIFCGHAATTIKSLELHMEMGSPGAGCTRLANDLTFLDDIAHLDRILFQMSVLNLETQSCSPTGNPILFPYWDPNWSRTGWLRFCIQ